MTQLLLLRKFVISFIKKHETVLLFAVKFIIGMYIFHQIGKVGLWRNEFAPLFKAPLDFPFFMLLSLAFALFPPTLSSVTVMFVLLLQISTSLEVTFFVFLILFCFIVFYVRLAPQKSYLILALLLGFYFKVPYVVILFAGLYLGVMSVFPIMIGTFTWYFIPFFKELVVKTKTPVKIDIVALPTSFIGIFKSIFTAFTSQFDWIVVSFVFIIIALAVYAVSRLSVSFSKEIAIAVGGVLTLICMPLAAGITHIQFSFGGLFLGTLFSVAIMYIIRFFDCILLYHKAERVQFEDEENYYYVKIIPKMLTEPEKYLTAKPFATASVPPRRREAGHTPIRLPQETSDLGNIGASVRSILEENALEEDEYEWEDED